MRRGRRGNSANAANVIKKEENTAKNYGNADEKVSAVLQTGFSPPSMLMPNAPNTNGSSATYVDSAPVLLGLSEKVTS